MVTVLSVNYKSFKLCHELRKLIKGRQAVLFSELFYKVKLSSGGTPTFKNSFSEKIKLKT